MMVRLRVGRLLLRGAGLGLVGAGAYTIHNAGYEVNNIGKNEAIIVLIYNYSYDVWLCKVHWMRIQEGTVDG